MPATGSVRPITLVHSQSPRRTGASAVEPSRASRSTRSGLRAARVCADERAQAVADDHRPPHLHRVEEQARILGEVRHAVTADRRGRAAMAALIRDQHAMLGEVRRQDRPDPAGVGEAVQQEQGPARRIAELDISEPDAVGQSHRPFPRRPARLVDGRAGGMDSRGLGDGGGHAEREQHAEQERRGDDHAAHAITLPASIAPTRAEPPS